jgi:hypothetical protein
MLRRWSGHWLWACLALLLLQIGTHAADAPAPLLDKDQPVDWWFTFKFNANRFPQCGGAQRDCIFDHAADPPDVRPTGQQFVFASHSEATLAKGDGCIGDTTSDPVGATFSQVYNGSFFYIIWNDQFYDDPRTPMCSTCGKGTGHSKGMLAWNDDGDGLVLQVTTPSWPGAGSKKNPRHDAANTLGCIIKPNNVIFSQHFFSLKLNKDDLVKVLKALKNASVVTDPTDPQLARLGGPKDIKVLAGSLGKQSGSTAFTKDTLSSGVMIISKPADLHVPPWQMVSAVLDGIPLRVASWWNNKKIFTTTESSRITCWDKSLPQPGPVEIALTGMWERNIFGLHGGPSPDSNHAKVGVSTSPEHAYAIFGDMNQEGASSKANGCDNAQNVRGGLFFVVEDEPLHGSVRDLIAGETAPTRGPRKKGKS